MGYYFPNVDPTFIYQRKGTTDDPYISRHETGIVSNGIIVLMEIPNFNNKVISKKVDGTALTEVTTDTLGTNEYRVDYSTGIVYYNNSLEGTKVTNDYLGMGYISVAASRVYVDSNTDAQNKSIQQLVQDMDNVRTNWLTAVTTYADIATTYPTPNLGDTVQTTDDSRIYRYDGGNWVNTQQYSANALTDLQTKYSNITTAKKTKSWTATQGQLIYTFDTDSYISGQLTVYVGGVPQIPGITVQEDSTTQFTLLVDASEITAGLNVVAVYR